MSCRYVDTDADIDIEYRDIEADIEREIQMKICLLYTSDAADE